MKISKYTFLVNQEDNCTVVYNCFNEALSVIETELAEMVQSKPLEEIKKVHPTFYEFLIHEGFVVEDDVVEENKVIDTWKAADKNRDSYNIFINPTLDCNLHCWYCYEKHIKHSLLDEKVMHSLNALVDRKVMEGVKNLSFSFFGGEPLLVFQSVVQPLLLRTGKLCQEHNICLYVSFVTNGTLLSPQIISDLKQIPVAEPMSFQIALDGNEYFHDKTKSFSKQSGSYRLILENVGKLLQEGWKVTLRFNMIEENMAGFYDVLTDLHELTAEEKLLLTIDLQRVWQDSRNSHFDFLQEQSRIREAFLQEGFRVNELKHIDPSRCYADKENHVTVNYDGSIFKCTARDFTKVNSEGMLCEDGTLCWNDKYQKRLSLKYGNKTCQECRIFPLCHGGCSQYKMDCKDEFDNQLCIRGYDDLMKKKIVEDRIQFLLERLMNN